MSEIIKLQNHRQRPTDNFTRAAQLIHNKDVLIIRKNSGDVDLQGGYRLEDLNEIYEKAWNSLQVGRDWMFVKLFKMMQSVQKETAGREVSEARDQLLAIVTGLSDKALDNIRTLKLGVYESNVPKDALLQFTAFADDKRREYKMRSNYGQPQQHNADVLAFTPRAASPAPAPAAE